MRKPCVDLVCDGNKNIGYGHVRRTLTLAETLRQYGMEVRVTALSEESVSLVPQHLRDGIDAPVVVFDVPHNIECHIDGAQAAGRCVVALDWFGAIEPDVAIVVYPHQPVRARLKSYIGLEYQMIPEEITTQLRCTEGEGVVVILGGGDLLGQGHVAASRLSALGLRVTLVQGPFTKRVKNTGDYEVLFDPPELPSLLASSAWMVTNGGGCMFEAMFLGKPTVAIAQTSAELVLAKHCQGRGALLGVGLNELRQYSDSEMKLASQKAARLIDGRGVHRVAEIVRSLQ